MHVSARSDLVPYRGFTSFSLPFFQPDQHAALSATQQTLPAAGFAKAKIGQKLKGSLSYPSSHISSTTALNSAPHRAFKQIDSLPTTSS